MTWKKEKLTQSERAQRKIEEAKAALVKDKEGNPVAGPFYGGRRRGSGAGKQRKFAEKMSIPKKRG